MLLVLEGSISQYGPTNYSETLTHPSIISISIRFLYILNKIYQQKSHLKDKTPFINDYRINKNLGLSIAYLVIDFILFKQSRIFKITKLSPTFFQDDLYNLWVSILNWIMVFIEGPLHGIPYGLKDIISVPKYKTTWGSKSFKNQVIDMEAWVYKR